MTSIRRWTSIEQNALKRTLLFYIIEKKQKPGNELPASRARCVINAYYDVKFSLCSFSRNEQAVRLSGEEKSFIVNMKLVSSYSADISLVVIM